ncbi:cytochrome b [Roseixanthobacter glucoisosaccharinicivorans]|uniref:cytochrome b n=1 Tax=Roseixanthobacter glucoisosaccharinicivorans TaxID=3119923 RepID=UPI003726831E
MSAGLPARWSLPLRWLHWAMAALLMALLGLGLAMAYGTFDLGQTFALYQWHKSLGVLVLPLVALRLALRVGTAHPVSPPAIGRRARLEAAAARIVHALFYVLMLALPFTGWLVVSSSPLHLPTRPFNLFTLPDLVAPDADLNAAMSLVHATLAYLLLAVLALHVAGAVKHWLVDRDRTAQRMSLWPAPAPRGEQR